MSDTKVYLIVGIVCTIVGFTFYWYVCGKNLYDNGIRINTTYQQSERIGKHQQSAYESVEEVGNGLDGSIDRVDRIEERNDRIKESVDTVKDNNDTGIGLIRESTDRVRESKAILDRVRERETKN